MKATRLAASSASRPVAGPSGDLGEQVPVEADHVLVVQLQDLPQVLPVQVLALGEDELDRDPGSPRGT